MTRTSVTLNPKVNRYRMDHVFDLATVTKRAIVHFNDLARKACAWSPMDSSDQERRVSVLSPTVNLRWRVHPETLLLFQAGSLVCKPLRFTEEVSQLGYVSSPSIILSDYLRRCMA